MDRHVWWWHRTQETQEFPFVNDILPKSSSVMLTVACSAKWSFGSWLVVLFADKELVIWRTFVYWTIRLCLFFCRWFRLPDGKKAARGVESIRYLKAHLVCHTQFSSSWSCERVMDTWSCLPFVICSEVQSFPKFWWCGGRGGSASSESVNVVSWVSAEIAP